MVKSKIYYFISCLKYYYVFIVLFQTRPVWRWSDSCQDLGHLQEQLSDDKATILTSLCHYCCASSSTCGRLSYLQRPTAAVDSHPHELLCMQFITLQCFYLKFTDFTVYTHGYLSTYLLTLSGATFLLIQLSPALEYEGVSKF